MAGLVMVAEMQVHHLSSKLPWPSLPQDLAEFLPTVTNLLDSVNLPTIPFVNFDLDSIKDPLVTTSEQLTYVLDQGESLPGRGCRRHACVCWSVHGAVPALPQPPPPPAAWCSVQCDAVVATRKQHPASLLQNQELRLLRLN